MIELYQKMARPPKSALRTIEGGRLKGMSDINPQWRYEIMTEIFGLCGIGWKYTIDRTWTEPASDGEVFCFVQVSLYIKQGDAWSEAIPAIGGNMEIMKERNKNSEGYHPYNNDECYKMALTDALGTAMQRIGVAADVYAGKWDGSKYLLEEQEKGPAPKDAESAKRSALVMMVSMPPDARKELFKKHGGIPDGLTPDGKEHWVGIDWIALEADLKSKKNG